MQLNDYLKQYNNKEISLRQLIYIVKNNETSIQEAFPVKEQKKVKETKHKDVKKKINLKKRRKRNQLTNILIFLNY